MGSQTINLSDSLNNWLDSLQLIKQLRLNLSDNLNNWADSGGLVLGNRLTQEPVEVLTGSIGNVRSTQEPVEVLTPTNGLIEVILSDTVTFSDSIRIGRGNSVSDAMTMTDSVSAVPSGPITLALSDTLNNWQDLVAFRNLVQLSISASDSLNNWLDSVTTLLAVPMRRLTQEPVEVITGSLGKVRDTQAPTEILVTPGGLIEKQFTDSFTLTDSLVKAFPTIKTLSDTMTLSDSVKIGFGLRLSDSANNWLDSLSTLVSTPIFLSVSDSLNFWLDSATTAVGFFAALSLSLSDNMNFWQDLVVVVETSIPRTAPSGDPTNNCCPPNIFITD